nr:MAG TPA: hypothetical protein [Bacteriophage sp.]
MDVVYHTNMLDIYHLLYLLIQPSHVSKNL